jgi:hypothetical protein
VVLKYDQVVIPNSTHWCLVAVPTALMNHLDFIDQLMDSHLLLTHSTTYALTYYLLHQITTIIVTVMHQSIILSPLTRY